MKIKALCLETMCLLSMGAEAADPPAAPDKKLPESTLYTGDRIIMKGSTDQLTPLLVDERNKLNRVTGSGGQEAGNPPAGAKAPEPAASGAENNPAAVNSKDTAKFFAPARTKFKVVADQTIDGENVLTLVVVDSPCVIEPQKGVSPSGSETPSAEKSSRSGGDLAEGLDSKASTHHDRDDDEPSRTLNPWSVGGAYISTISVSERDCKIPRQVSEGHAYQISKTKLEQYGFNRIGWIYGGLIIPYKFFPHDNSLEPATTLGPFLGYRMGHIGWGVSIIGTLGVTSVKVRVVNGDNVEERDFNGISRGIGLMFDISKSTDPFRFGIMWGKDKIGSNNTKVYPHEGHSWVAMQLGWEFGR